MIRAWVKLIWNSLGVAVVAAAAQLGVAEAVGIVGWGERFSDGNASGWSALLTWVGFVYVAAVLAGAAVGVRAVRRPGMAARITAALAAGVGAAATVGVAWLPARKAQPPVNLDPELVVVITAAAGVIVGVAFAVVALSVPPFAHGVRAAVAWIWLAGVFSAVAGIATHEAFAAPRLGVVDAPSVVPIAWWSGPNLMIGLAGALGLSVAAAARRRGANRAWVALGGVAGPAVVCTGYLIAGPGPGDEAQFAPYRAALVAASVGLAASVLFAIPGRRGRIRVNRPSAMASPAAGEPLAGEIIDGAPTHASPPVMGRPPRSYDEEYSDWLKDLGQAQESQALGGQALGGQAYGGSGERERI